MGLFVRDKAGLFFSTSIIFWVKKDMKDMKDMS